ncbi:hypothetical protein JXA84_05450 [candidate division WOR-3 bacterium]|nr:hypothetical protein [candidate division WOR-3 bacterium]
MRIAYYALIFLFFTVSLTGEGLEGVYSVWGTNGENEYEGELEVIDHFGAYEVNWLFGGEEYYIGVGIKSGEYLAVSYTDESNSDLGAVLYKIEGENLKGIWATLSGLRGFENAFRTPEESQKTTYVINSSSFNPEGEYRVLGTNSDSSEYTCSLHIEEYDDIFAISWIFEDFSYDGIAFSDGSYFVCSWTDGSMNTIGVSLMRSVDNDVKGVWAFYGANGFGTEIWKRD